MFLYDLCSVCHVVSCFPEANGDDELEWADDEAPVSLSSSYVLLVAKAFLCCPPIGFVFIFSQDTRSESPFKPHREALMACLQALLAETRTILGDLESECLENPRASQSERTYNKLSTCTTLVQAAASLLVLPVFAMPQNLVSFRRV